MSRHLLFAALAAAWLVQGSRIPVASAGTHGLCDLMTHCTVPSHMNLVACPPPGGDPDNSADSLAAGARFTVVVRDIANNPVGGVLVEIEIPSPAHSGVRIGSTQHFRGEVPDCEADFTSITATTNGIGQASFVVIGGGAYGNPTSSGGLVWLCNFDCVYFGMCEIGTFTIGVYDLDGGGGVSGADLSKWSSDFFGGTNPPRSDYNGDGRVGGTDLSLWSDVFWRGREPNSPPAYCP